MKKKNKLLIGGAIAALLVAYLVWSTFTGAAQSNRTVSEITSNPDGYIETAVRVSGKVVTGSIEKPGGALRFKITDKKSELTVFYEGSMPNSFQDGADIIADGELSEDGVFLARSIMVKCPSKYSAEK